MQMRLPRSRSELLLLAGEYDYRPEGYERHRTRLLGAKHITRAQLVGFCEWKSPRNASTVSQNSEDAVEKVTHVALSVDEPVLAVRLLCCLKGVGVSIASAALAFAQPDRHAVIDRHTLNALGVHTISPSQLRAEHYEQYLVFLERERGEIPLRSLEQGLFMWSRNRQRGSN